MAAIRHITRQYALDHPTRDGQPWGGWCGSLMYRFCATYGVAPTGDVHNAITVAHRSAPLDPDHYSAPPGAFHFWDWRADGHVGLEVGGGLVFMASSYVTDAVAPQIGFVTVEDYNRQNREARYLGWSLTYADGKVTDFDDDDDSSVEWVRAPGGAPGAPLWPSGPLMARAQRALRDRTQYGEKPRYVGPCDGDGGPNTASGMQYTVKQSGYYDGPVDGALGGNFAVAMQQYARDFGDYVGPIDGDPRYWSWLGFILGIERP